MKKSMYILVLFLCACCVLTAGKKKEKKAIEIKKMECYSILWDTYASHQQQPAEIINRPSSLYDKFIVNNYAYLRDLQGLIAKLKVAPDSAYIDARIVCLLYKSDKSVDTLSFGSFRYCEYNGKRYYLTWQLLSHILNKVSHEQFEIINRSFQYDPQIKARLEERDK